LTQLYYKNPLNSAFFGEGIDLNKILFILYQSLTSLNGVKMDTFGKITKVSYPISQEEKNVS